MKTLIKFTIFNSIILGFASFTVAGTTVKSSTTKSTNTQTNPSTSNSGTSTQGTVQVMPNGASTTSPTQGSASETTGTNSTTTNTTRNSASGSGVSNNTGSTTYDNRTGVKNFDSTAQPNSSINTPGATKTTVPPNAAVSQQLTLNGIEAKNRGLIVQYARQAGASGVRIEGNKLIYSGNHFDKDRFSALMSTSLPDIHINN